METDKVLTSMMLLRFVRKLRREFLGGTGKRPQIQDLYLNYILPQTSRFLFFNGTYGDSYGQLHKILANLDYAGISCVLSNFGVTRVVRGFWVQALIYLTFMVLKL